MKRLFCIFFALILPNIALAGPELGREYGKATQIPITMRDYATPAARHAALADISCYCSPFSDSLAPINMTTACIHAIVERNGSYFLPINAAEMRTPYLEVLCQSATSGTVEIEVTINTKLICSPHYTR